VVVLLPRAREEDMAARKALRFLIPAALGALVATQWPDIVRYLKIKQLSLGQGNPGNCQPAAGWPTHRQQRTARATVAAGKSRRPAGWSTVRDSTDIDTQEPIEDNSPYLQHG
jgi:hypothetical protein